MQDLKFWTCYEYLFHKDKVKLNVQILTLPYTEFYAVGS
jgi:hypothetical protein